MTTLKYITFAAIFWAAFTITLLTLNGCTEIENIVASVDEPITTTGIYSVDMTSENSQPAPIHSGYNNGYQEAANFLDSFEWIDGYPFGGDRSIHLFLICFQIPLLWDQWQGDRAGLPVTQEELHDTSSATITLCTRPDESRMTPYHHGALDALNDR